MGKLLKKGVKLNYCSIFMTAVDHMYLCQLSIRKLTIKVNIHYSNNVLCLTNMLISRPEYKRTFEAITVFIMKHSLDWLKAFDWKRAIYYFISSPKQNFNNTNWFKHWFLGQQCICSIFRSKWNAPIIRIYRKLI